MAKGVRATTKQRVVGRHNLSKGPITRIGLRGQKYAPRKPKQ